MTGRLPPELAAVLRARRTVEHRTTALEDDRQAFAETVRAALEAGHPAARIAGLLDVSPARVYQIRDGGRRR